MDWYVYWRLHVHSKLSTHDKGSAPLAAVLSIGLRTYPCFHPLQEQGLLAPWLEWSHGFATPSEDRIDPRIGVRATARQAPKSLLKAAERTVSGLARKRSTMPALTFS